jgi:D-amino-acid oxidase
MNRRNFLQNSMRVAGLSSLGLSGCARNRAATAKIPALPFYDAVPPLVPIRAHTDRIFRITVCLRPFRAEGPRLDVERVNDKVVVHNYGHGGSGWSLSWGSSAIAVRNALKETAANQEVAVIGCGALGLTSALLLQRAGAKATIYAKERPPEVRSSRATGSWTPDSRVALRGAAPAAFAVTWEEMARASFAMYQSYLGMAGNPIEWTDRYSLSDPTPDPTPDNSTSGKPDSQHSPEFAEYRGRIRDLTPSGIDLPPGSHPFPTKFARRNSTMTFNVAAYSRQLMTDFLIAGGAIETREFFSPSDLTQLRQKVIVNATGYGARALWKDESITPVRGQIAWLIPQPDVNYGLSFGDLNVVARRDGIVVQSSEQGEATGWKDESEVPDRAEADRAIQTLANLYSRMGHSPSAQPPDRLER